MSPETVKPTNATFSRRPRQDPRRFRRAARSQAPNREGPAGQIGRNARRSPLADSARLGPAVQPRNDLVKHVTAPSGNSTLSPPPMRRPVHPRGSIRMADRSITKRHLNPGAAADMQVGAPFPRRSHAKIPLYSRPSGRCALRYDCNPLRPAFRRGRAGRRSRHERDHGDETLVIAGASQYAAIAQMRTTRPRSLSS